MTKTHSTRVVFRLEPIPVDCYHAYIWIFRAVPGGNTPMEGILIPGPTTGAHQLWVKSIEISGRLPCTCG